MTPYNYLTLAWRPPKTDVRVLPGDDLELNDATLPFSMGLRALLDVDAFKSLASFYDWPEIPTADWDNRLKVIFCTNLYVPDELTTDVNVLRIGLLAGELTVADFVQGLETLC